MAHKYYCARCPNELQCAGGSEFGSNCPMHSPGYAAHNALCGQCVRKEIAQAVRTTAGVMRDGVAYTRKELLEMAAELER